VAVEASAFTPTDPASERARSLAAVLARLPRDAVVPIAASTSALRARAADVRIEIGE
jgi:hypothetical protein